MLCWGMNDRGKGLPTINTHLGKQTVNIFATFVNSYLLYICHWFQWGESGFPQISTGFFRFALLCISAANTPAWNVSYNKCTFLFLRRSASWVQAAPKQIPNTVLIHFANPILAIFVPEIHACDVLKKVLNICLRHWYVLLTPRIADVIIQGESFSVSSVRGWEYQWCYALIQINILSELFSLNPVCVY